jgi:hypothetical protein
MAPAYICCAVSRVPAPAVSSSLNAKGGDSLHELDVPDRVRVCTACGTCSTSTGKHPKLSMETVLPRIPDCLRRHQRAEMRVAFVSACNGCKLKCEFTESRKSANRLRRCNVARHHAHRLRAATGTVAPPFYRWSKIGRVARPRQYACNDRGGRNPRSCKRPAPPRDRSRPLSDRAPACASTADPVSRWSKIGRVARPRQYACNDRGGRNLEVR